MEEFILKRILLFSIILIVLTACSTNENDDDAIIYTSIYPLEYIVQEIAEDKVDVQSVYPPGVDAHTYEPTSKEITELADGEAFIYLGAGMESFSETIAEALKNQDMEFIEIGQHKELFSSDTSNDETDVDPHIWLDPMRMIQMAETITKELNGLQPDNKTFFLENLSQFTEKMTVLDEEFTDTLKDKDKKEILVAHAAYGYWEQRYDIEQIPISGLSSSDEPSQKELTSVAKLADENDLDYVIFDVASENKVATILQEHIDADPLYIHNLEVLTEENIEDKEDYYSIMKKNLKSLDQATNE